MKANRTSPSALLVTSALILVPVLAQAHPGHGAAGFTHGLIHPLGGLDHLLAMFAVGLWAAQKGGRALWALPAAFLGVMTLGGALGMAMVGLFALCHGLAHGAEMPENAAGFAYGAGFVLATALLHACGIAAGLFAKSVASRQWAPVVRFAGAAIAMGGLMLCIH